MNAYVSPASSYLSTSSDYYSRTLHYLAQRHPGAEPSGVLARCRPALGRLRQGYRELSRRTDRMDYAGEETQLAYLLAYTPHHAGQLLRAMSRFGGLLARRPDHQPTRAVFLAAGPGSELLGCSFALRHPAPAGGQIKLQACLVDKRADSWQHGRAVVNYHLQHPDHRNVVAWTGVCTKDGTLRRSGCP